MAANETLKLDAPRERSVWALYWQKAATILAVIDLAGLVDHIVKWAKAINWVIENYKTAKLALFGWLPFHIPKEWHDVIILSCIFFSVTNVGLYRRTGQTYITYVVRVIVANVAHLLLKPLGIFSNSAKETEKKLNSFVQRLVI